MAFDYATSQVEAKAMIAEFGIAAVIRYAADNTTENTTVALVDAVATDIDNKGHPNVLPGTVQLGYIAGDIPWAPSIGDALEYYIGANKQTRRISAVATLAPNPNIPLLYTLTLA